jgi:chemotaxis protein methyltransferase CheR
MPTSVTPKLTDHELADIRALIERRSGICFDEGRERFLTARVREHLAAKHLKHGTELLRLVNGSNAEYDKLLERLLTQETSFYRYPDVFRALQQRVLPAIHGKKFWQTPRTLRVWSAGCSTGEEPYSLAMTIFETLAFADAWDIALLATDISRRALDIAEQGTYSIRQLGTLPPGYLETHFAQIDGDRYQVRPRIRGRISFAPMNLAQMVYMGRFDVIVCMNVLIYFSPELQASLVQRFYEYLEPGGYLFLGHAESMAKTKVDFETIVCGDSMLYQKPGASAMRNGV